MIPTNAATPSATGPTTPRCSSGTARPTPSGFHRPRPHLERRRGCRRPPGQLHAADSSSVAGTSPDTSPLSSTGPRTPTPRCSRPSGPSWRPEPSWQAPAPARQITAGHRHGDRRRIVRGTAGRQQPGLLRGRDAPRIRAGGRIRLPPFRADRHPHRGIRPRGPGDASGRRHRARPGVRTGGEHRPRRGAPRRTARTRTGAGAARSRRVRPAAGPRAGGGEGECAGHRRKARHLVSERSALRLSDRWRPL